MNSNGTFASCAAPVSTGALGSSSLAIGTAGNANQYLYITGYSDLNPIQCALNNLTGSISSCAAFTSGVLTNPNGAFFTSINDFAHLYIEDQFTGAIKNYLLNINGSENLNTTYEFVINPPSLAGINFATVGSTEYAYLTDYSSDQSVSDGLGYLGGKIWRCGVDQTTSALSSCTWTPAKNPGNADPATTDGWNLSGASGLAYMTS